MTQLTSIGWTLVTWNPIRGCSVESEGCGYCYAAATGSRFCGAGLAYEGLAEKTKTGGRWTGKVVVIEARMEDPLRLRTPSLMFVNSMSDLFHEEVPLEVIQRIFDVMRRASHHQFQVLTKRSQRLRELAPQLPWPTNLWMGVSIESPKYIHRIDDLRATGAAVKFLSIEPLLAPFDDLHLGGIDWVIAGGESGRHLLDERIRRARALVDIVGKKWVPRADRVDWVRSIRDACAAQRVPFFFKQWGGVRSKSGGRLLDGVTHDGMPAAASFAASVRRSLEVIT